jgi:hypothetical protein
MANGFFAGVYSAWIATRDSNGYPVGTNPTPDSKVVNTVYGPLRLRHPISIDGAEATIDIATRRGGMAKRGQRALGASDYGAFKFVMDAFDDAFDALVRSYTVDTTTQTGLAISAANATLANRPRFVFGCNVGFTDDSGNDLFMNYMFPNVQIIPAVEKSSQQGGENPNPLEYTVVPDVSTRTPLGRLFSAMGLGVRDNQDILIRFPATREYIIATYVANGVATSFTLPFKPTSSSITGAADLPLTKNGATQAVTSISTTTGLVTLTGAGAANDIYVVTYPTAFL